MASPDITPYVDLTLDDKDPQDIFDVALSWLQIRLPDWNPQEGNTEVMLLEAHAQEIAELIFAINRVPSAVLETLLKLLDVERDAGAPPTVELEFTMSGTSGYTIPLGVQVILSLDPLEPIVFTTESELVINPGDSVGYITATGDRFTTDGNGVPSGTLLDLLDSVVNVDKVETSTDVTGGRDAESDDDYFARAVQRLARLTDTLVLPSHFLAFALEQTYVERAFVLDNYDPGNDPGNDGPVGSDGGHVTVAVYGDNATVSGGDKTALEAAMESSAVAMLDVHVIDPTITNVNVTVTVKKKSGYDDTVVQNNVIAALENYMNPMTWEWGSVVRKNELISIIDQAEGVDYVTTTFPTPASDTTLNGVAPLANAGTLTITVT